MATFNKFQSFAEYLCEGVFDFNATGDTLNIYLTNNAPSASLDLLKADLAELATGNGYTGPIDTQNSLNNSSGTIQIIPGADPITITASGGSVGPFRYVVLYDDTPTTPLDPLIGWWDYGSAVTLASGEDFVVDFGATMFTVA